MSLSWLSFVLIYFSEQHANTLRVGHDTDGRTPESTYNSTHFELRLDYFSVNEMAFPSSFKLTVLL